MKNKYTDEIPAIGAPARRALEGIGVTKLTDLSRYSEAELLALHGFGPKALGILWQALKEKGMKFSRI